MGLPIRTTLEDVNVVCKFLASKALGATMADAKAVLDSKHLDGRKLSALRLWGLIEENGGRMKVTAVGRNALKGPVEMAAALCQTLKATSPYLSIVERAHHRGEASLTSVDVAAHWAEHHKGEVGETDAVLNDQAVCFFHVVQGAGLGTLVMGRKGSLTRVDFDESALKEFVEAEVSDEASNGAQAPASLVDIAPPHPPVAPNLAFMASPAPTTKTGRGVPTPAPGGRVFITHGSNKELLDPLKDIVKFGKFEPVIAAERETTSIPVPDKVMDEMRNCCAAIIHVAAEGEYLDAKGNKVQKINENVLIEIGAALALYGRNFILLVEDGLKLPSNLQGLYECRYHGDTLDVVATMKLLKAFNQFTEQAA